MNGLSPSRLKVLNNTFHSLSHQDIVTCKTSMDWEVVPLPWQIIPKIRQAKAQVAHPERIRGQYLSAVKHQMERGKSAFVGHGVME